MKILRPILGLLSLVVGLILLGECAAHTARALLHFHPMGGSSALLMREAFLAPGHHGTAYLILFYSGLALLLTGTVLTRAWPLPFFVFGAACLVLSGGIVVERFVGPKGPEAAVLQDGISGIWDILAREDALMPILLGNASLIAGLFAPLIFQKRPAPAPSRGTRKADRGGAGTAVLPEPDGDPLALTPTDHAEGKAETSVDLDFSPDLETSEVQAPDPLSISEAPPPADAPYIMEMEAPPPPAPVPVVEAPLHPPLPEPEAPKPPVLLPVLGALLGLASLASGGAAGFCALEAPTAGLALTGAISAGLAGMGLALLGRPIKALGWTAVGISALGLGGAAALLVLGE